MRSEDVFLVYGLLHRNGYISFPLTEGARKSVEAITENINSAYFGHDVYDTPEKKLVALLYFLIKDHPFTDGNKRTAVLAFETACALNDIKPEYEGFTLDELALFIEQEKREDHHVFIAGIAEMLFQQ